MSNSWERRRLAGVFLESVSMADPTTPWRSRGYLPHFDQPGLVQALTFRLHDSLPAAVVEAWRRDLDWRKGLPANDRREVEMRARISKFEDSGHGACWLRRDAIAELVEEALLHNDEAMYRLLAWCVMPNHVHALIETREGGSLATILQSWKSFTAHRANRLLDRQGTFWAREYHDRFVRDETHLRASIRYIEGNPVKAGWVARAEEWRWGSARRRVGA